MTGTVRGSRQRKGLAILASFELQAKFGKGVKTYRPVSHSLTVNPFIVATDDGRRLRVQPNLDAVTLHAPVEGTGSLRSSRLVAGDRVWVYGPTAEVRPVTRSGKSMRHAASKGSAMSNSSAESNDSAVPLLISTEPIGEVFRAERNRRLWLTAAVTLSLVVAELLVFGNCWDVVRAGEPVVGHVEAKWWKSHKRRERTGATYREVEHFIAVEANGRHETLELSAGSWDRVEEGTRVALLLSPTTAMLGPEPYTTVSRCSVMTGLWVFGLLAFMFAGAVPRPWYSTKRGWRGVDRPPRAHGVEGANRI